MSEDRSARAAAEGTEYPANVLAHRENESTWPRKGAVIVLIHASTSRVVSLHD
jgi:hypothetical protein